MDTTTFLATSAFGLVIWAVILGLIIESSTKSKKIERHLRIQTDLLTKMAENQGVSQDAIDLIINQK